MIGISNEHLGICARLGMVTVLAYILQSLYDNYNYHNNIIIIINLYSMFFVHTKESCVYNMPEQQNAS